MSRTKHWRRFKFLLLLGMLFAGGIAATEEYFQWSRLRNFSPMPPGVIEEDVLWKLVPREALRCWWTFPSAFAAVEEYLNRMYPLRADLGLSGFGSVLCRVTPLRPQFLVRWNGQEWYVDDEEGAIWQVDLPENGQIASIVRPEGPVLDWGEDLPSPVASAGEFRKIFRSRLPLGMLQTWRSAMESLKIFPRVQRWKARKCKGLEFVEITLTIRGHPVTIVLDGTKASSWSRLVPAVEKIVESLGGGDVAFVADTSYEDKIVVRRNYQ